MVSHELFNAIRQSNYNQLSEMYNNQEFNNNDLPMLLFIKSIDNFYDLCSLASLSAGNNIEYLATDCPNCIAYLRDDEDEVDYCEECDTNTVYVRNNYLSSLKTSSPNVFGSNQTDYLQFTKFVNGLSTNVNNSPMLIKAINMQDTELFDYIYSLDETCIFQPNYDPISLNLFNIVFNYDGTYTYWFDQDETRQITENSSQYTSDNTNTKYDGFHSFNEQLHNKYIIRALIYDNDYMVNKLFEKGCQIPSQYHTLLFTKETDKSKNRIKQCIRNNCSGSYTITSWVEKTYLNASFFRELQEENLLTRYLQSNRYSSINNVTFEKFLFIRDHEKEINLFCRYYPDDIYNFCIEINNEMYYSTEPNQEKIKEYKLIVEYLVERGNNGAGAKQLNIHSSIYNNKLGKEIYDWLISLGVQINLEYVDLSSKQSNSSSAGRSTGFGGIMALVGHGLQDYLIMPGEHHKTRNYTDKDVGHELEARAEL